MVLWSGYDISKARPNGVDISCHFPLLPLFPTTSDSQLSTTTTTTTMPIQRNTYTQYPTAAAAVIYNIYIVLFNIRKYIILSRKSFSFDSFTTLLSRKNTIKTYNVFWERLINCRLNNHIISHSDSDYYKMYIIMYI